MSYLFKLSKYISVPVFLEWLSAEEILLLDSSLCNQLDRKKFLSLMLEFKGKFWALISANILTLSFEMLEWCQKREFATVTSIVVNNIALRRLQCVVDTRVSTVFAKLSGGKSNKAKDVDKSRMMVYLRCFKQVRLHQLTKQSVNIFCNALKHFESLCSISLYEIVNANSILKILRDNGNIIQNISILKCNIKEKTLIALCKSNPTLQSIELLQCCEFSLVALMSFTIHNRQLTSLLLDKCFNIGIQIFAFHFKCYLQQYSCSSMSDFTVRCLIWFQGIRLSQLDVSNSTTTDYTVSEIGTCCPKLDILCMKNCYNVSTLGIHSLTHQLPFLKQLDLCNVSNLTNEALACIVLHCSELQSLSLYTQELITQTGLRLLGLYGCKRLTSLALNNMRLMDNTLIHIVTQCKYLTTLSVSLNGKLTDQAFSVIAPQCTQLKSLDVTCCDRLTEVTLFALAAHCYQLTDLNVSICNLVSDKGVIEVATQLQSTLTRLNLFYCKSISDASIAVVVSLCRKLTHLNIAHTAGVSSRVTLEKVVRSACLSLQELTISSAEQSSVDWLNALIDKVNPNIHVIIV